MMTLRLFNTLIKTKEGTEPGKSINTVANTGQYL